MITFNVIGVPSPQGSKSAFINKRTGRPGMKESAGKGLVAWRDAVASAASVMAAEYGCLDGALRLVVLFRFTMPASRTKAERLAGVIWRTSTPDSSKILRSLEDALVDAGLIADDKLIVEHVIRKVEVLSSWSGAQISVGRMTRLPGNLELPVEESLFERVSA